MKITINVNELIDEFEKSVLLKEIMRGTLDFGSVNWPQPCKKAAAAQNSKNCANRIEIRLVHLEMHGYPVNRKGRTGTIAKRTEGRHGGQFVPTKRRGLTRSHTNIQRDRCYLSFWYH